MQFCLKRLEYDELFAAMPVFPPFARHCIFLKAWRQVRMSGLVYLLGGLYVPLSIAWLSISVRIKICCTALLLVEVFESALCRTSDYFLHNLIMQYWHILFENVMVRMAVKW